MDSKDKIIFKAITGSQAYGTSTPESDIDYKGIVMQHSDELISFGYKEQFNITKDETYYELRRFMELLSDANPTALELLHTPKNCILTTSPQFELLYSHRDKFITQKCINSFAIYGYSQIKKAQGLDKKMNWENSKITRKTILDFCYVLTAKGTIKLKSWLLTHKGDLSKQENYGVSKVPNARDMYYLFPKFAGLKYKGICNIDETSNELRLSSIPKSEIDNFIPMTYNKDGYVEHCKDYRSYQDWLKNRNENRYVDTAKHGQMYDGKNLLHCRRLLDIAIEISELKTINVKRPNAEYLLKIKKGEFYLETIINKAEQDIKKLPELFKKSGLPEDVDKKFVNDLLLEIRHI